MGKHRLTPLKPHPLTKFNHSIFFLHVLQADLKRRNKINSRKFGTKGELTEQLALVLKALWTCKNDGSDYSTSFKAVVDRYGTQFRSSTQHDAQEFLFWLLDKVHEDLNTASKRKYKSIKVSASLRTTGINRRWRRHDGIYFLLLFRSSQLLNFIYSKFKSFNLNEFIYSSGYSEARTRTSRQFNVEFFRCVIVIYILCSTIRHSRQVWASECLCQVSIAI